MLSCTGKKASVPLDDALRLLRTPQVPRLVDANTALDLLRGPAALGTATSSGPGQLKIGERLWCLVSGDAAPWFQDMLASLPASHEKGMSCSITATAYLTFQRQMPIAPHSDTECSKKMRPNQQSKHASAKSQRKFTVPTGGYLPLGESAFTSHTQCAQLRSS